MLQAPHLVFTPTSGHFLLELYPKGEIGGPGMMAQVDVPNAAQMYPFHVASGISTSGVL